MFRFVLRAFSFAILSLALALGAAAAPPAAQAPDQLVRSVTEDVLAAVRADKDIQNGNSQKTLDLVNTRVLPHFNFDRMTALAVGRDWNKASPKQKQKLIEEFRELLVRTYSSALSAYRDQSVRYKPFTMTPGDTDVMVKTEVTQPGKRPVQLDYSLAVVQNGKTSAWKVYDVVVAGVSLVTNYRDTFAQEVRKGGIDGLIASLAEKNKSLSQGKK